MQISQSSKVTNITEGRRHKKLSKAQQEALERLREEKTSARHVLFCDIIARLESLDLSDVAETANVHVSTLWNWVHGDVTSPLFNNLAKVAKALGLTLELVETPTKKTGMRRYVAH